MQSGYGVSVSAGHFTVVRSFINSNGFNLPDGTYSLSDLYLRNLSTVQESRLIASNYVWSKKYVDPGSLSTAEAMFLHGSVRFELMPGTEFVVINGVPQVRAVIGVSGDNFDFESANIPDVINDSIAAALGFDPEGVTIEIEFVGQGKTDIVDKATLGPPPFCFASFTKISLVNDALVDIADISPGNIIAAFDGLDIFPAVVTRVFRNVTQEWLKLVVLPDDKEVEPQSRVITSCQDSKADTSFTYVTPGHLFLNEIGEFEPVERIVCRGGMIVRTDGKLCHIAASRITFSEDNAGMFEEAEVRRYYATGGLACEPHVERGWATYNFEVEKYHTYIANGWRVHNDSQIYIDAAGAVGQAFGSQLGQLMMEGESQFAQLAVGTALGTVTRNIAEVISNFGIHGFQGKPGQINVLDELNNIDLDFAGAAVGTASSFLIAELGEMLNLDGFGEEMFNVIAGTYAGSVFHQALIDGFDGIDWTKPFEAALPAKRNEFKPHQTPGTDRVIDALQKLKENHFPEIEIDIFLTEETSLKTQKSDLPMAA
jgi:hypothetical protein